MRATTYLRAAACSAALLGFFFGVPGLDSPGTGVASAAPGYYTKKRVNGVWVTGRFAKKGARKAKAAARPAVVQEAAVRPEPPQPPSRPEDLNPQPALQAAVSPPAAGLGEDERMRSLHDALRSYAERRLLGQAAAGAGAAPPIDAATTGSAGPAPRSEPRSVTFDFGTGVKTTIFADGSLATEPFDVSSARGIAARR